MSKTGNSSTTINTASGLEALYDLTGDRLFSDPIFKMLTPEEQSHLRNFAVARRKVKHQSELTLEKTPAQKTTIREVAEGILGIMLLSLFVAWQLGFLPT